MNNKFKNMGINKYLILAISVLMVIVLIFGFSNFYEKKYDLEPEKERERIISYMVTCYATEGFYPPDLYYLEDNYGLVLKNDKYYYFYDAFASNIMPDIIITRLDNEGD